MNGNAPPNSTPLSYMVALLGSLLILWVLVSAMRERTQPAPLGSERAAERLKNLEELTAKDMPLLTEYGWEDKAKGIVRLPVERSMELVVQGYQTPDDIRSRMVSTAEEKFAPPPETPSEFE